MKKIVAFLIAVDLTVSLCIAVASGDPLMAQFILGVIAAHAVHEAGHVIAARLCGLPSRITLTWMGPAAVIGHADIDLTRWQVRMTAIAGPAANLLFAFVVCVPLGLGIAAALSLVYAVFNLLPIPKSDGTKILLPGRAIRRAREAEAAQ
jgi:Zn-dependent protease